MKVLQDKLRQSTQEVRAMLIEMRCLKTTKCSVNGKIFEEKLFMGIHNLNNVSSNLSSLADDTVKN
jgi:hypothetical protein